jgi:hypothetical protein
MGTRFANERRDLVGYRCLEVLEKPEMVNEGDPRDIEINLVAELAQPYAVYLRSKT